MSLVQIVFIITINVHSKYLLRFIFDFGCGVWCRLKYDPLYFRVAFFLSGVREDVCQALTKRCRPTVSSQKVGHIILTYLKVQSSLYVHTQNYIRTKIFWDAYIYLKIHLHSPRPVVVMSRKQYHTICLKYNFYKTVLPHSEQRNVPHQISIYRYYVNSIYQWLSARLTYFYS